MFGFIDQFLFGLGEFSPEEEYYAFFLIGYFAYHSICKFGPANFGMAHGFSRTHGKGSIEHEYPLFGPFGEVAMVGNGEANILVYFFVNINEGRGRLDAILYGKAKTVCLSFSMIGVLAQQDHFYLFKGGKVKGVENKSSWWVNGVPGRFLDAEVTNDLIKKKLSELIH